MSQELESTLNDLWQHLTSDRQAWLLGAGVSFGASIPLMYPLTTYVQTLVAEADSDKAALLDAIRVQLPEVCHIEHVLSQLGDLIALAQRSRSGTVAVNGGDVTVDTLRALHHTVLTCIGTAVRYGYRPSRDGAPEVRGSEAEPLVTVDDHRAFVRQLFASRSKPGFKQTPVSFFTTNYDTLIEDSLALERVPFLDGFVGGAMGYWSPDHGYADHKLWRVGAKVFKLHGSIDWHLIEDGNVMRCRSSCRYPDRIDNLLIYPQSTKYVATQKDPFAALFGHFRTTLAKGPDNVLGICGYSFGDDHVDGEIEAAMSHPLSKTVIVAFVEERETEGLRQLPPRLKHWLSNKPWSNRVFVASSHGLYHGNVNNLHTVQGRLDWWTFQGLTTYLAGGPDVVPATPTPPAAAAEIQQEDLT